MSGRKERAMSQSDLIFIIGRQRSGTTVLRDLICRTGALNADEIFHGDLTREYRFYGHVAALIQGDSRFVHPQTHAGAFRSFIEALRVEAAGAKIAMDVKYFGLNLIPQLEDVDATTPYVVTYMKHQKAHVVHVIRKNKLRVFVSEEMSRATGKWSAERPEHMLTEKPALQIDPKAALTFVRRQIGQDARVTTLTGEMPWVMRIHYDEMFDADGQFSAATMAIATAVTGEAGLSRVPGNLKMNPEPLSRLVGNYAELSEAFAATPYLWMLDDPN
jgi:hypothetical protein